MPIKHSGCSLFYVTVRFGNRMYGERCVRSELWKEPLPDPNEYFGFEMRNNVTLSVNCDLLGLLALLEVYDKNPMETVNGTPVKKEGIEALFKIYTDENENTKAKWKFPLPLIPYIYILQVEEFPNV